MFPEEMFSAEFYNTRVTQFYDFYKREILSKRGRINEGMKILKRLEDRGILQAVITRDIYSLPKRAGCKRFWRFTEAFTGMYARNAEQNIP